MRAGGFQKTKRALEGHSREREPPKDGKLLYTSTYKRKREKGRRERREAEEREGEERGRERQEREGDKERGEGIA